MSPILTGIIGILVLLILLASGMPIGFAMGSVGFAGFSYLCGMGSGLAILNLSPYATAASYGLSVIPLFVLMGQFVLYSGLGKNLYYFANRWIGHFSGGLSMATIAACAGFAAISGSSTATAATIGTVSLPEMRKYKYSASLATGSIAAGGTLGILIPPSMILILYGVFTDESIGELFIAGILPGLLLAVLLILTIYMQVRINPQLAPLTSRANLKERLAALKGVWEILILFVVVIGGIYIGIFTPTEAAAIGAAGGFILALIKKRLTLKNLAASLLDTGQTTAMIFIILIGATIFGQFLAVSRIPMELAEFVVTLGLPRHATMAIILFLLTVFGCFMPGMAILVLAVPILFPVIQAMGFDPIWFGVVFVIVLEIGLITPPVGLNVFIISGVAKDVPVYTIFRGVLPFLLVMLIFVVILVVFPQIALFLPNLMQG